MKWLILLFLLPAVLPPVPVLLRRLVPLLRLLNLAPRAARLGRLAALPAALLLRGVPLRSARLLLLRLPSLPSRLLLLVPAWCRLLRAAVPLRLPVGVIIPNRGA